MSNADNYPQFNPTSPHAPAIVSVLANKLLAKRDSIDGSNRFGDIDAAIAASAQRRGDFSMLIYIDGSAQIDSATTEKPKMPAAAIIAEAVLAEFGALCKKDRERILARCSTICDAVRAADRTDETLPTKSSDKIISLAETMAPEIAAVMKNPLKERPKAPAVRTTGSAYILTAELSGQHVDAAVSSGGLNAGVVGQILLNDPALARQLNTTRGSLQRFVKEAKLSLKTS